MATKLPDLCQLGCKAEREARNEFMEVCARIANKKPIMAMQLPDQRQVTREEERKPLNEFLEVYARITHQNPITTTEQKVEHHQLLRKIKEVEATRHLLTSKRPPRLQKLCGTMRRYVSFLLRVTRQAQVNY